MELAVEPTVTEDGRLPHKGDLVIVDLPRAVRGDRGVVGAFRVTFRNGLKIRVEGDELMFPVPVGVPVAVRWGHQEHVLFGTVVAVPEPRVLHIELVAPVQARRHQRYRLHLPAVLELFQDHDCPALHCHVVDLSQGGVKLSIGSRVDLGTQAFVSMEVPRVGMVMAVAEVLDCSIPPGDNIYEARLRFSHISDEAAGGIAAFLQDFKD